MHREIPQKIKRCGKVCKIEPKVIRWEKVCPLYKRLAIPATKANPITGAQSSDPVIEAAAPAREIVVPHPAARPNI